MNDVVGGRKLPGAHAIHQSLGVEGKFCNLAGLDHTTASLQGMEGAPYDGQRLLILALVAPTGHMFSQLAQRLVCIFQKNRQNLRINRRPWRAGSRQCHNHGWPGSGRNLFGLQRALQTRTDHAETFGRQRMPALEPGYLCLQGTHTDRHSLKTRSRGR